MKPRQVQERLADKNLQALLVNYFKTQYHYSPAMAEAILRDTVFTRTLLDPQTREDGQIIRYLPRSTEPAGKPLAQCELVVLSFVDVGLLLHLTPVSVARSVRYYKETHPDDFVPHTRRRIPTISCPIVARCWIWAPR